MVRGRRNNNRLGSLKTRRTHRETDGRRMDSQTDRSLGPKSVGWLDIKTYIDSWNQNCTFSWGFFVFQLGKAEITHVQKSSNNNNNGERKRLEFCRQQQQQQNLKGKQTEYLTGITTPSPADGWFVTNQTWPRT